MVNLLLSLVAGRGTLQDSRVEELNVDVSTQRDMSDVTSTSLVTHNNVTLTSVTAVSVIRRTS